MRIFIIDVRAESTVNLQHTNLRILRRFPDGQKLTTLDIATTAANAATNTTISTMGVAMKAASDMKWLEWRHGAANDIPLKISSLKTERNAMNRVYAGGHGTSKTTFSEALICKLPMSTCVCVCVCVCACARGGGRAYM